MYVCTYNRDTLPFYALGTYLDETNVTCRPTAKRLGRLSAAGRALLCIRGCIGAELPLDLVEAIL